MREDNGGMLAKTSDPEENKMTEKNLTERLNFREDDVLLDGKVIFSVPHRHTKSEINLLGVTENGEMLFVGSGECCYGPITILHNFGRDEEPDFKLDAMRMPDFNVYDIIPARVDHKKTGFLNDDAILTTGYGCAGSGVRLISAYTPKTIEVVSGDEFRELENRELLNKVMPRTSITPRLIVDEQEGRITLDLFESNRLRYSLKPREGDLSRDFGFWASKDLTPVLNELGVDVEKTIEANRGYSRIEN